MRKLVETGRYNRPPAEAAWTEIQRLRTLGWSSLAIATAADLPHHTIEGALQKGKLYQPKFGVTVTIKILKHGDPTDGTVGITGARRRLQGLACQGYSLADLERLTGLNYSSLAAIRQGPTQHVRVPPHLAIRDTTNRIGMTPGPSTKAQTTAQKKGWVGLLAWEDNIDDPTAMPYTPADNRRRAEDLAAEWEHLRRSGVSLEDAAKRIGVARSTLQQAVQKVRAA